MVGAESSGALYFPVVFRPPLSQRTCAAFPSQRHNCHAQTAGEQSGAEDQPGATPVSGRLRRPETFVLAPAVAVEVAPGCVRTSRPRNRFTST